MNIHHLELFYYVARHGGITEAVRNIPYGIQQPAVSGQVAQLEEYLGVALFQRRPFALTAPGEKLYKFIQPFFSNLDVISAELQGGKARHIRIGASTLVLRDHLPDVCQNVRKRFANLKISLREGYQQELEGMLERDEIDLAVTLMAKRSGPNIRTIKLVDLPLVMLVPAGSKLRSPGDLWGQDRIGDALICLPEREGLARRFQEGLSRLGVDWFTSIEVSSVDLVEIYVANGFGLGATVEVPGTAFSSKVRALPLDPKTFPPVAAGAMWRGKTSALVQAFLDELQLRAKRVAGA